MMHVILSYIHEVAAKPPCKEWTILTLTAFKVHYSLLACPCDCELVSLFPTVLITVNVPSGPKFRQASFAQVQLFQQ